MKCKNKSVGGYKLVGIGRGTMSELTLASALMTFSNLSLYYITAVTHRNSALCR